MLTGYRVKVLSNIDFIGINQKEISYSSHSRIIKLIWNDFIPIIQPVNTCKQ